MTLRVVCLPTHPSLCNTDRTKGTPACENMFACLGFHASAQGKAVCVRLRSCLCVHSVCMKCPTIASPHRCGFNLYLSFSMLHCAQYAQRLSKERGAYSSNKADFLSSSKWQRGQSRMTPLLGINLLLVMAVSGYLSFHDVRFVFFDRFWICLALICSVSKNFWFSWRLKRFAFWDGVEQKLVTSTASCPRLKRFRDFCNALIRR